MSRDFFMAAERAALDRVVVPALSADFADAVVASAMARPARVSPRRPIGLNWREWRRHTRMLFGFGLLGLAGAAAAAAGGGLLGHLPERIPQLAAAVGLTPSAPAPKQIAHQRKPRPAPTSPSLAPVEVAPALPPPLTDEQIAMRRARLLAYRAAVLRGEAPPLRPIERRLVAARVRERIAAMPPEERAELQARFAAMTPEQRARARVAMEVRFLANHPRLAERFRERRVMADEGVPPPLVGERIERLRAWRERRFGTASPPVTAPSDPSIATDGSVDD